MPEPEADLEHLMSRGQAGDAEAHRALLRHLAVRLRRYFHGQLRRTGAPAADAEDLVQDTLLAIHTRRHTYDGSAPVLAWTFGIARYKLIDHLRASARTRREIHIDEVDDLAADDPFQPVDTARELHRALETLPSRFRLPIEYVKLEGLSIAEAAARIGISDSAVKIGIHRGMKRLAVALSEARP
ncbi:sigma-70 family RNA polymerase sigma factor [Xanthobacter sp. V3C-3]|uniref:sigma-70 family RNA polymerase sigma factor n=1 Tax=Xanthobacter lutulentifluminis TaxID=3119935 RepID=UPI0037273A45